MRIGSKSWKARKGGLRLHIQLQLISFRTPPNLHQNTIFHGHYNFFPWAVTEYFLVRELESFVKDLYFL